MGFFFFFFKKNLSSGMIIGHLECQLDRALVIDSYMGMCHAIFCFAHHETNLIITQPYFQLYCTCIMIYKHMRCTKGSDFFCLVEKILTDSTHSIITSYFSLLYNLVTLERRERIVREPPKISSKSSRSKRVLFELEFLS